MKSGIYSYVREGFGDYAGFNSAERYWISAMLAAFTSPYINKYYIEE